MGTDRRRAGVAGVVAVAMALGVGEMLAGLFEPVPSPLAAVGAQVILYVPPVVEDAAIGLFGTADKAALAIGTVIIALVIGWFLGVEARSRPWVAVVVFAGFGALGVAAGLAEPLVSAPAVVIASLVAATSGVVTLRVLIGAARDEPEPTDGVPGDSSRRRFVRLAASGVAVAAVAGGAGRVLLARVPPPSTTVGSRSAAVIPGLIEAGHELAIDGLSPVVTPNEEFFRIDTALVIPRIDASTWELSITGMVARPVTLDLDDLAALEHVERHATIACVSNQVGGDLIGNALWSGPLLADVLEPVGVASRATQIVGRSIDGWSAGFPTALAFDDRQAMIALTMNGEPLPRRHGYPARLIVPGLYGYVSATKWLSEIELTTWEGYDAYWIPRGWAKEGPIKLQSRIDRPHNGERVRAGEMTFAGVAWAPTIGIGAVQVRIDEGSWQEARTSIPLSDAAWVQWSLTATVEPGVHVVAVRAVDSAGEVQTDERTPPRPDGATGHHEIGFVAR